MSKTETITETIVLLIVVAVMFAISFGGGYSAAENAMRIEAVKNNAAEWVIVDERRKTEFRWKGVRE